MPVSTNPIIDTLRPSAIREMFARARPDSINLTLGQPTLPPDPELIRLAREDDDRAGYGYTPNEGLYELRALIAAHHPLPERLKQPENVLVTVGSSEAMFVALSVLVKPGDKVLLSELSFPSYANILRFFGAEPIGLPCGPKQGYKLDLAAIQAGIAQHAPRGLILNSPSNPFGQIDDSAFLSRLGEIIGGIGDFWAVSDEIYRDLLYTDAPIASLADFAPEQTVVVSGLSKSHAVPGMRLGYLIAEQAWIAKATRVHQMIVGCAPRFAQHFAIRAFQKPESFQASVPFYEAAREAFVEAAKGLPKETPYQLGEGAFYATLDLSFFDEPSVDMALDLLEEENVVVVPGSAFGEGDARFWRLSYAGGAEPIRAALPRIGRFLARRVAAPGTGAG